MPIRAYIPADLPALSAINAESTPGVSDETEESLGQLIALGTCLVAADEGNSPLGFINLVAPGTQAYPSENLRWFERWQAEQGASLHYVDRIAIAARGRGQRLGQQLYEAAFRQAADHDYLGCEINTDPDNPGSHRFHRRLGFELAGEARYATDYAVAYYVRRV